MRKVGSDEGTAREREAEELMAELGRYHGVVSFEQFYRAPSESEGDSGVESIRISNASDLED